MQEHGEGCSTEQHFLPQAIPCSAGEGERGNSPNSQGWSLCGIAALSLKPPFDVLKIRLTCSALNPTVLFWSRSAVAPSPLAVRKAGKQPCGAEALQGSQSPVSLPGCGDGTSTPAILPGPLPLQLQPAGHSNAGEMEIFPSREERQEPINVSDSKPYLSVVLHLQEYFVPLVTFIKQIAFPGTVWWMLVSVQGSLGTGTSALQRC